MVRRSSLGYPLLLHCAIDDGRTLRDEPGRTVIEVSRLAVSRNYNRRAGDGFYSLQGPDPRKVGEQRKGGGEIVMALYKALYQASKHRGITHWLMAAERSLRRLITRYGFPFSTIGPESDYYGLVVAVRDGPARVRHRDRQRPHSRSSSSSSRDWSRSSGRTLTMVNPRQADDSVRGRA